MSCTLEMMRERDALKLVSQGEEKETVNEVPYLLIII
jgi:hypothetical protein